MIKKVKIGCASGFWGDTDIAAPQLVNEGNINYLVFDYLAEVSMSILAGAKLKNSSHGYAKDFINHLGPLIKKIKEKNIKVISNAGGVNLEACRNALLEEAKKEAVDLKIIILEGDDLLHLEKDLRSSNIKEIDTNELLPENLLSVNAYLGAPGIKAALELDADIVITGRCVDSALVLGPLMYEFDWRVDDYDLLASGSLAGHIIECGAQCTGGNFTDWESVERFDNIGFPIIEVEKNGNFIVTKPKNTGGVVNFGTVSEQFLYEIGNPSSYLLPDVICDFTNVSIKDKGNDVVSVKGVKGNRPSNFYKVSATYQDGFKTVATLVIGGPKAVKKAYSVGNSILKRTKDMFLEKNFSAYKDINVSVIGSENINDYNNLNGSNEVVLRVAARHEKKEALIILSREIAQAATGMAPGIMNYLGGRPSISPSINLFSFMLDKKKVKCRIDFNKTLESVEIAISDKLNISSNTTPAKLGGDTSDYSFETRLINLAYARSGDKGNHVNVGIIAREPEYFSYIKKSLTTEKISSFFKNCTEKSVVCWELPKINGLNFLVKNSLGGGGMSSLLLDPQGKAYAQYILNAKIAIPELIYSKIAKDNFRSIK